MLDAEKSNSEIKAKGASKAKGADFSEPLKVDVPQMSDKLGQLEVQRVEASDELEKIRKQSSTQVHSQTSNLSESDVKSNFEKGDGGFLDLLEEANLSIKHLKFCCGGIFILFIVITLIYGAVRWVPTWKIWSNKDYNVDIVENNVNEFEDIYKEENEDTPFMEVSESQSGTIYAGLLLGMNESEPDPAIDAGVNLGGVASENSMTDSIRLFARLYESMQVDVQDLLDQSKDRRATLSDYADELRYLYSKGERELKELRAKTDNLVSQFTQVENEKDIMEDRFFDKLGNLDAYGADAALEAFIIRGEEVVSLRARYLAYKKLIEYYDILLADIDRRIFDIDLNEEALVKGIQVVDIQGSDLDLIIQESEL